ncbi:MAG: Crp/Fnr family transcriptional regulator [Cyclobacteriaceae bacterium]|nr:Crp/Fnr family transcriptional regulator [Cyclobacteriaceae bacterium]
MDTSGIFAQFERHITLDEKEKLSIRSVLIPARLKQGEFVETVGKVTSNFIFVNLGCLMTYYTDAEGTDHVIQFAMAGWWTGDLHSFTKEEPSIYSTRALSDSEVFYLPKTDMEALLQKFPKLERYFRILFQNSIVSHQHRLIQNLSVTADQRYENFSKRYPSLEQYVPLKYIASYLGITPEFLSKIRRKRSGH